MKSFARVLFLLPAILIAATGSVTQTFSFTPADFVFDRENDYDVVALPGQYWTSEPGTPNLPLATYNIVIPADAEVTGIEVSDLTTGSLPGTWNIHPCQRPYVLSGTKPDFVEPDQAVYTSDRPYPAQTVTFTRSGCLGGYRIAGIQVAPLQYVPSRKELQLARHLVVKLLYETGVNDIPALDESQVSLLGDYARSLVQNPDAVTAFAPRILETDDWRCDLMVITNNSLRSAFQAFVDWKNRRGFKTVTVTTESIYSTYTGRDNQEKIRNCVIDYWQNHGLKWLLVGGDDGIVPVRLARQVCEGNTGDIATDLYYADLQGSWDSNHNNLFGEMGDSMDLFYDIFVGRWCADNAADVAMFFAKDTMYEKHPDSSYIKKVLFGSTMLFSPYHGKVINHIIANLFPTGWQFNHLEDPPSGQYASAMNSGYQFAHVAAHGNSSTFSVMDASEAPGLTNGLRKLNFVNSIACESGWFDGTECLAEALVKAPNGGCIATMLNSRYGFGYPPGFGPSEMLDEQFYIYAINKTASRFGNLCALSKDYFRSLTLNQEVWRWCVYELNLLGDPTLNVWFEPPSRMAVTAPASVPTGPQTCRVMVRNAGLPVNNALVCLNKGTETYARGWTNSQGWLDLLISPLTTGSLSLSASAPDFFPYDTAIPVTGSSTVPVLVFSSSRFDIGKLHPGDTADLFVSLTNSGAVAATGVTARLRPFSSYISLLDSISSYGTIAPGATVEGDRFRVAAAPDCPPGFLAEFVVAAFANEGTWQPYFSVQVGDAPPLRKLWADHDIGNMILSVTSVGSVGTMGPYCEGSGLKYPRTAGYGSIYLSSFAAGTDATYIVDRWYSHPTSTWQTDWRPLDTLHAVEPPIATEQEYQCVIDDAAHASPKGLTVTQWSGSLSRPGYDDFVIVTYTLENRGAQPLNDLHCGIFSDFDVNNATSNSAGTDNPRRLAWMSDDYSIWVGMKLLNPTSAANVSIIDHSRYITPGGMITEAVKDSLLRGAIRLSSGSGANYSCVASAGPFNLAPGSRQKVAFAFVGGSSTSDLQVNADSAQSWYDHFMPAGLTYLRSVIEDPGPGGNNDGIINPGESINLPTWVANRADRPASGVWGILRKTSLDTLVTVTDSVRRFGSVGAGDSVFTGMDGFRFRTAAACTNGYLLPFQFVCYDTLDSSYTSSLGLRVGAPQLVPSGTLCWDPAPGGNNNGRLDPGEHAEIALGITNSGLGNAQNVSAVLKSGDTRLVILDSLGAYGNIRHDSTTYNSADRYAVLANSSIPRESQISCTLRIHGDGYQVTRPVLVNVGVMTQVDPIPDGPRTPPLYYAYDDVDVGYIAHPTYNWVEVNSVGTRLSYPQNDDVVLVDLPPEFGPLKFYGQRFTQISVSADGWILPGNDLTADYSNTALPDPGSRPGMICGNWDDLSPYPDGDGYIYSYHDAANHRFIVEWDSVAYWNQSSVRDKFEIILMDTTIASQAGNNDIIVQYMTANGYTSSTLGIEDPTQAIAIQVLYNGAYHRLASPIVPGHAICYSADSLLTALAESGPGLPTRTTLAVFPNPLRTLALVRFSLSSAGHARVTILDVTGREVRALCNGNLAAGSYALQWNRRNNQGKTVPAGIYICRLETGAGAAVAKTVVLD